jgi:hypothetical protein
MLMNSPDQKVETNFKYTDDQTVDNPAPTIGLGPEPAAPTTTQEDTKPLVSWTALDSFSTSKNFGWYFILLLVTIVVAAGIYLLTKDKITTGVILVSGLLIAIYGGKKPKAVKYALTDHGFKINDKSYEFNNFRSFSIVQHSGNLSAVLTPLKRFMPYMYIYFGGDVEKQVTTVLSDVLPIEMSHRDLIDKITRRIGF